MQTILRFSGSDEITVEGTLAEVADRLTPAAATAAGYCELTDAGGRRLMVNPARVIYLAEHDPKSFESDMGIE